MQPRWGLIEGSKGLGRAGARAAAHDEFDRKGFDFLSVRHVANPVEEDLCAPLADGAERDSDCGEEVAAIPGTRRS